MARQQKALGRSDGHEPWLSANARTNIIMSLIAVAVFLAWHLCVVIACGAPLLAVGDTLRALIHADPIGGLPGHPHVSGNTLLITFAGVIVGVFVLIAWVSWVLGEARARRSGAKVGGAGLAAKDDVEAVLGKSKAEADAKRLRPSLSKAQARQPGEIGFEIGRDLRTNRPLWLGFEDSMAILGGAGSGKSSCFMEPAAIQAPGALIVTSNEVGILDTIAAARRRKGRVWVFDPLNRSHWPEPMVWDPVAGCEDGEMALARAKAFVAGCGADGQDSTNAGFFRRNAEEALKSLLHAAAIDTQERTMDDVLAWCTQLSEGAVQPREIIDGSRDPRVEREWAGMLEAVATGAEQTVSSSRNTLVQVVTPLTLKAVKKWVIPHEEDVLDEETGKLVRKPTPVFDAKAFVRSRDTLVLLSDDSSATNVGPLCTMLLQEVVDALKAYVPMTELGRLDPPMDLVGDEIANIAPIDKLPELSTEVRKLGMRMMLAFQSDQQPIIRWGEERGRMILDNIACEGVLPGVKSLSALNRYSDLAGSVEVLERTDNFDQAGQRTGTSRQLHERKVLRPDEIRQLERGTALIIYRGAPGIMAKLLPWFERPGADQIKAERARSAAARREYHARRQEALTKAVQDAARSEEG